MDKLWGAALAYADACREVTEAYEAWISLRGSDAGSRSEHAWQYYQRCDKVRGETMRGLLAIAKTLESR